MDGTQDSIGANALEFSRRYRTVILSATAVAVAASFAIGLAWPSTYFGRTVVQCASIPPDGAVENVNIATARISGSVTERILRDSDLTGASISVRPVRGEPPLLEPTDLLEITASAPTEYAVRVVLEDAANLLVTTHTARYASDRARIDRHVKTLEEDLDRFRRSPVTTASHPILVRLIADLANMRRQASRAKSYAASVIAPAIVEKNKRTTTVSLLGFMGLMVGIGGGYAIAFVLSGYRSIKSADALRTSSLESPLESP